MPDPLGPLVLLLRFRLETEEDVDGGHQLSLTEGAFAID